VIYAAWGWTAGIALWVHILVLPFVLCSGLLILVFCYREWRSLAIPCLLLGVLLGGFLLIPGHSAISHALIMQSGATILPKASLSELANLPLKQFISTFIWGIPLTDWFQPACSVSDLPLYGSGTSLTLPCSFLQGSWVSVTFSCCVQDCCWRAAHIGNFGTSIALKARISLWQNNRKQSDNLPV